MPDITADGMGIVTPDEAREFEIQREINSRLNILVEKAVFKARKAWEENKNPLTQEEIVRVAQIIEECPGWREQAIKLRNIWNSWMENAIVTGDSDERISQCARARNAAQNMINGAQALTDLRNNLKSNWRDKTIVDQMRTVAEIIPTFRAYRTAVESYESLTGEQVTG